jgi:phosphomethylpyrimidine synthase
VRVYDTSGPYTDPNATIDIAAGLAPLRREWILARGDVEDYEGRAIKPEDNGLKGPDRSGGVPAFPGVNTRPCAPRPGRMSARCIMPAAASSRPKWNMWRSAKTLAAPS